MTNKKRQRSTLKASNMGCTTVEASRKKLAEDFLARLNRSTGANSSTACMPSGPSFILRPSSSLRWFWTVGLGSRWKTSTGDPIASK